MISPPSMSGMVSMPWRVPQSNSLMIVSCATSTSRRVRYPEFAVLSAVSARPLRAPCVEMKYCRTDRPSRKFVVIGVSMISPDGLAIRPRMPDSCRICCCEPRAPESAMMKIELKDGAFLVSPLSGSLNSAVEISFIMSLAIASATCAQMSTTLL